MPSTYTTSLKIQQIGSGEQSGVWGNTTNTNWNLVEQAITGVQTITMLNADYTLTNLNGVLDEARNAVLVVNGTNSAVRKIIAPVNQNKTYIVSNQTSGGFDIIIGAVTGSYVAIPNGTTAQVYTDGTNFYSSQTGSAGNFDVNGNLSVDSNAAISGNLAVTGTTTFTGIPSGPTASAGTNTTQLATTAFVVQNAVLTGSLFMWPTSGAPSGYLVCNGAAVSRSIYAALFAVIGTTFGAGDNTTTFNLPNYVDKMPIGLGNLYNAGSTGGSADAVVVSHNHTATSTSTVTDPGHNHTYQYLFNQGLQSNSNIAYSGGIGNTGTSTTGITVATSTTVASAGVTGTNANLPPYLGINFIIKT